MFGTQLVELRISFYFLAFYLEIPREILLKYWLKKFQRGKKGPSHSEISETLGKKEVNSVHSEIPGTF